eukprot:CAMPEP_0198213088 /NCGR_PEP_ID=MMETSP1445-20131203/28667_1 /TAXON_ID=36898 /ORGANISM="Pyramimonas sp., Strain CCMP2087" /LENGTH=305 /DNA_ID=CAMNT_0043887683 /DNA_START=230 /DNA_END=1147 /DNA_ORIENTATION=+
MGNEKHPTFKAAGVECLAMGMFVYICCGTAATNVCCSNSAQVVAVSLAFGFTIMVLAHGIAHISGGHINPAVTLALIVTKRIELLRGLAFIGAQLVGSIIGSLLLYASLPHHSRGCLGANTVGGGAIIFGNGEDDYNTGQAFLLETICTFILVFTVMATVDPANGMTKALGVFPIGMAVFICHIIAIPLTGCGINPARSFGPGIIAYGLIDNCDKVMDDHWVFWLAPFLGAAIAALGYNHLVQDHNQQKNLRETFHAEAFKKDADTAPAKSAKLDLLSTVLRPNAALTPMDSESPRLDNIARSHN